MSLTKVTYSMIDGSPFNVRDFGATGNGLTDDTAAVQAAIDFASANDLGAEIFFPQGVYRLTATINVNRAVSIRGVSAKALQFDTDPRGGGTWFYIDHTGKGFSLITAGGTVTGDIYFSSIGTYRNQPAAGAGWTPTAHDYDFWLQGAQDVTFTDIVLLNPTNGISSTGSGGRLNFYNLRGQPFDVGIYIDSAYDICRFDQIHFWPFWSNDANVMNYTKANFVAFWLLRCDNPFFSNIFTIETNIGFLFSQSVTGTTQRLHAVNVNLDGTTTGIKVDSSVTTGCTAQFTNITHLGTSDTNSRMLLISGNNCLLDFGPARASSSQKEAVRVEGTGNILSFSSFTVDSWALAGGAVNAVYIAAGSSAKFANTPLFGVNGGAGTLFNAGAIISAEMWIDYTPVVTASSGAITAYTASGRYKRVGNEISYQVEIDVSDNGTAASVLRCTLPYSVPLVSCVGVGREIILTGYTLSCSAIALSSFFEITTYDNLYPAANGCRIILTGTYVIG